MLVLSRKKGESVVIADNIVIRVLEIRPGGQVQIGIEAPRDIPVHRMEVWEQLQADRQAGGNADS